MTILDALQNLVQNWRDRRAAGWWRRELDGLDPAEVDSIALEFGMSAAELRRVAAAGASAGGLMSRMLQDQGLDATRLRGAMPAVVRDIEITCSRCAAKHVCERELRAGTAAAHAHEFCPNSPTFEALRASAF